MTILERLEAKRKINPETGCWEWKGCKLIDGYGGIKIRINKIGFMKKVHRVAYETYVGPIPEGIFVLHHCDNPPCFNPEHLFLGTHQTNMDDMYSKGRGPVGEKSGKHTKPESCPRGSKHPNSKLTEKDVAEIRAKCVPRKYTRAMLAAEYGVRKCTIDDVLSRSWRHVK